MVDKVDKVDKSGAVKTPLVNLHRKVLPYLIGSSQRVVDPASL